MPAYSTAEVKLASSVSGWYFGNIAFGGFIGMLIVDPMTGAMFNLAPDKIEQPLTASQAQVIRNGSGFLVVLASQITEHERVEMVRVEFQALPLARHLRIKWRVSGRSRRGVSRCA